jgi:RNA recognition motif-containing protein
LSPENITQRVIVKHKEYGMKLYVGNLSYTATEEQVKELFSQYGEVVQAKIIYDRMSNRSKGFAFVEMSNEPAGTAAMTALDGSTFLERNLKVDKAKEQGQQQK